MTEYDKLIERILSGSADANIAFDDVCRLLVRLGFEERIRGSHHIFTRQGVEEIANLQPRGAKAKPYQVRQLRHLIFKYKLGER